MKVHLLKAGGTRSACHDAARPSSQVKIASIQEFADTPAEHRCSECEDLYQRLIAHLHLKPGVYWILEGDKRVPAEWNGKSWWGIAMMRAYTADEVIDPIPACFNDARRLDWAIQHQGAEFAKDAFGTYVVAYLTSGEEASGGVSGRFLGRGETHRDCIDVFLQGRAERID